MPAKVSLELTASFTSNSTQLTFLKVNLAGSTVEWADGPAWRDPSLAATRSSTAKLNAFVRIVIGYKLGVLADIGHFVGQLKLMRLKPSDSNQALRLLGGTGANGIGRLRDLFEDPEPPICSLLKISEHMLPALNISIFIRSCADAEPLLANPEEMRALYSGIHPTNGKVVSATLDERYEIAENEVKQIGSISTYLSMPYQTSVSVRLPSSDAPSKILNSNADSRTSLISDAFDTLQPIAFMDSGPVVDPERSGHCDVSKSQRQDQRLPSCDAIETPGSIFYVERAPFAEAIGQLDSNEPTVIIRGHRQSGRTSLLESLEADAKLQRVQVVKVPFREFSRSDFDSGEPFYCKLMQMFISQLKLNIDLVVAMRGHSGPQHRFSSFVTNFVEGLCGDPLLVLLDDVDLLFELGNLRDDFFSLIRGWSNLDIGIRIVVAHATEPRLWILDLDRSPFNVGLTLMLDDFSVAEMSYLCSQYTRFMGNASSPLAYEQVKNLHAFTGGHPRLTREALNLMSLSGASFEELMEKLVNAPQAVFSNLESCLKAMKSNRRIFQNLRMITKAEDTRCASINAGDFERLVMAGLVRGTFKSPRLRCKAYRIFFERVFA